MSTVRISGVGGSSEVEIPDGSPLSLDVALAEANIDSEESGLVARVNGSQVEDLSEVELNPGDQVTVTARDVKLG